VTGTFDGWSKSEKLIKHGDTFSKDVTLSDAGEKIYYKVRGRYISLADPYIPDLELELEESGATSHSYNQVIKIPTQTAFVGWQLAGLASLWVEWVECCQP